MKKFIAVTSVVSVLVAAGPGWAAPNLVGAQLVAHGTQRTLSLPAAADHAPVISLGTAVDLATGEVVEGYAIIHYAHSASHAGGSKAGGSPKCYTYIVKGVKWGTVEPWLVNPFNTRGLDGAYVLSNLSADISKWEDATDGVVGNTTGTNVLGDGSATTATLVADTSAPDGQNEVYFADVSTEGAIAVTIVWFNRFTKRFVEWDQVYDDVDYDWSASGEAGKMDFENIATHELGHSVGMGDLYNSCTEETMYGFAAFGETKKRDLNAGDIAGVNALY